MDAGVGVVWEKNPAVEVETSPALTAGEKLEHLLTATTALKHAANAIWRGDELADGLYTVSIGVGVRIPSACSSRSTCSIRSRIVRPRRRRRRTMSRS